MRAPLCDYISPKDPVSYPLLRTTKGRHPSWLSGPYDPRDPNLSETR